MPAGDISGRRHTEQWLQGPPYESLVLGQGFGKLKAGVVMGGLLVKRSGRFTNQMWKLPVLTHRCDYTGAPIGRGRDLLHGIYCLRSSVLELQLFKILPVPVPVPVLTEIPVPKIPVPVPVISYHG